MMASSALSPDYRGVPENSLFAQPDCGKTVKNHAIVVRQTAFWPFLRGDLRKYLLAGVLLVPFFVAQTTPLAYVALSTAGLSSGLPMGWQVKVNHGKPDVSVCANSDSSCVHLRSVKSSFGLERRLDIDPGQMPFLTWNWKVAQLPGGGDFRRSSTDDQAAQMLVAFSDHRIIEYLWDTTAPKGVQQTASFIPLVHIYAVVCESGTTGLNQWLAETRNVAADYERAYGKPAPHVEGLRIQINSQHTGTSAESYFGEVAFRSTPQE